MVILPALSAARDTSPGRITIFSVSVLKKLAVLAVHLRRDVSIYVVQVVTDLVNDTELLLLRRLLRRGLNGMGKVHATAPRRSASWQLAAERGRGVVLPERGAEVGTEAPLRTEGVVGERGRRLTACRWLTSSGVISRARSGSLPDRRRASSVVGKLLAGCGGAGFRKGARPTIPSHGVLIQVGPDPAEP